MTYLQNIEFPVAAKYKFSKNIEGGNQNWERENCNPYVIRNRKIECFQLINLSGRNIKSVTDDASGTRVKIFFFNF